MILKVYTVYDTKAEAYIQPFFSPTKGLALRSFQEALIDEKSNISKYPEDFTLFELGEFDQETAKFNLHNTPQSLGVAVEFLTPKG